MNPVFYCRSVMPQGCAVYNMLLDRFLDNDKVCDERLLKNYKTYIVTKVKSYEKNLTVASVNLSLYPVRNMHVLSNRYAV